AGPGSASATAITMSHVGFATTDKAQPLANTEPTPGKHRDRHRNRRQREPEHPPARPGQPRAQESRR
ncbi:hypothetical protein, partial [Propioniciclava flava]